MLSFFRKYIIDRRNDKFSLHRKLLGSGKTSNIFNSKASGGKNGSGEIKSVQSKQIEIANGDSFAQANQLK